MKHLLALALLVLPAVALAQDPAAPKGPPDWKVEVVLETPKVNYCSVVCCAPDGRIFLAEDPMDMIGPPNRPIDRILCIHPDGRITTYAENLYAVFGLYYMDGKLYVHHCPKFSVFDDGGDVAKNRVDLIDQTHPQPWGGMNDHIPSNMRLGMDGWFYMSTGDKGIYGAVGKDGSKAEIHGGGILRFRPDGTKLEVYCTGTRNHLDVAINAEDEIFTYDNTDDGNGWWTRLTHMVDGGFYGYPYDYKPRRPYTLWMMGDYGGGSPTGGLCYNEDALPEEYRGNLFMCEWGKGELVRFIVERDGATYKIVRRDAFLKKGTKDFRPVGVAVSTDGMSIYLADWNFGGWSNRSVKAGRLIKATYTGKSHAAPKPDWYVPAAMGKPFKATTEQLIDGLRHPAQSVRLVAMRRIAERSEVLPSLTTLINDRKAPSHARWSALWTLDRIFHQWAGDSEIRTLLRDPDPSIRRQALRHVGDRYSMKPVMELVSKDKSWLPSKGPRLEYREVLRTGGIIEDLTRLLKDADASVRFQAAVAIGRIADRTVIPNLLSALDDSDDFCRYAAFTALHRIGDRITATKIDAPKGIPLGFTMSNAPPTVGGTVTVIFPSAWPAIAAGLRSHSTTIRERTLYAFREAYDASAVSALAEAMGDSEVSVASRADMLKLLGELSYKRPAWKAQWWGTQPVRSLPPARTESWEGTKIAVNALRRGLSDKESLVREGAAEGIVATDNIAMAIELLKYLSSEKEPDVRKSMMAALAHVRSPNAEYTKAANELAVKLLQEPGHLAEAVAFTGNLPSISKDAALEILKQSPKASTPTQEVAMLEAIAKSNADEVSAALIGKTSSPSADIRATAVRLIAGRPGEASSKAITAALKDKAANVRKEAVVALGKRKDKSAVPALLDALADKNLRFDATSALAQMPDVRAAAIYIDGIGSKNNKQRDECARALTAIKKDALAVIEERLAKKPPLSGEVVLQLQKIYTNVPEARKSPIFQIAAKTVSLEQFMAAALNERGGNIDRGKRLFFDLKGVACVKCHKVGKEPGGEVGPDLASIGTKYNRQQLVESVLYPSKQILDGYDMTIIETRAGQVIQGIVRGESGDEVTLIDAEGKKHAIKKSDIETRAKSAKSIMPDGLQTGLTILEFADLTAYLESLRDPLPPMPANKQSGAKK
jgi:putative membrane-bound dehydrogenase-like protein